MLKFMFCFALHKSKFNEEGEVETLGKGKGEKKNKNEGERQEKQIAFVFAEQNTAIFQTRCWLKKGKGVRSNQIKFCFCFFICFCC